MQLSRETLRTYSAALSSVQQEAAEAAREAVARWLAENPSASVAEAREFAVAALEAIVGEYGDAAAYLAAEVFEEVMAAEGVDIDASLWAGPNAEAIESAVRYEARKLTQGQRDTLGFIGSVALLAAFYARQGAERTTTGSVEAAQAAGYAQVRFARIPTGPETCTFCMEQASRGFFFRSLASASHASHRHCDCLILPGVEGSTSAYGYSQAQLAEVYAEYEEIDRRHYADDSGEPLKGDGLQAARDAAKREAMRRVTGRAAWL